jgi:VWFA-related protein
VARISTVLAWLLVPLALASQNSPHAPEIRVSTRLVEIGVIVRDKNGPVADLRKEDFTVLDRGKPQKISVFSVESSESASQPAQPLPQNTFSDLPQYVAPPT